MVSASVKAQDSELACAKINLALHVRKRLHNGYHELETVFAFMDQGDVLHVEPAQDLSLRITGPFASGLEKGSNLVTEAAELLAGRFDAPCGASLTLEKNLPVASGIGGGSADAAATLRLLNRFWSLNIATEELAQISAILGADLPACVLSRTCVGKGIGQDLTIPNDDSLSALPLLLVNPLVPVPTAEIFDAWDGIDLGPLSGGDLLSIAMAGTNSLTSAAIELQPIISTVLNVLETTEPLLFRMSGSGATCFALYDNHKIRDHAEAIIRQSNPDMWIMSGELK